MQYSMYYTNMRILKKAVNLQKTISSIFTKNQTAIKPAVLGTRIASTWESWYDDALPTINVPTGLNSKIEKLKLKKAEEAEHNRLWRGSGKLLISCKRENYNHRIGQTYPQGLLDNKYLASNGWKSKKSDGDWIIFQPVNSIPAFLYASDLDFSSLGMNPELVEVIKKMSVKEPSYIQEHGIPQILSGTNTLITAETGSGKTLAYLLPIVQKIAALKSSSSDNVLLGAVIAPTYELVEQISSVAKKLCESFNLSVATLTGESLHNNQDTLQSVSDLVIATPGLLHKLSNKKKLHLDQVQFLVLDEGDTLMDDSFSDNIMSIIEKVHVQTDNAENIGAQIIIAGATLPKGLKNILGELLDTDAIINVTSPKLHHVPSHFKQIFKRVKPSQKSQLVIDALKNNAEKSRPTLVFCNKTSSISHLSYRLDDLEIDHCVLTKKLSKLKRNGTFERFQAGEVNILLATDIASRGLDTTRVKHVINYEFPDFISDYIHRVGRVARIGSPANCMATSYLCHKWEVELLWKIETAMRKSTELQGVDANIKRIINKDSELSKSPDMGLDFSF